MRHGAKFDGIAGLSSIKEELIAWIAELEGSLTRHEQRLQERRTLGEMRASGVRGLLIFCADEPDAGMDAVEAHKPDIG